ncbi:MAG TPA: hypothetical protein VIE89_18110 [Candidatus Binatia bacterium]
MAGLRHAGRDGRHPGARDASGDIHVAWISALHAGMTELRDPTETHPRPSNSRSLNPAFTFGCLRSPGLPIGV